MVKNFFFISQVMYQFRVRAHGSLDSSGNAVNQFTTNGNTPTGLIVRGTVN